MFIICSVNSHQKSSNQVQWQSTWSQCQVMLAWPHLLESHAVDAAAEQTVMLRLTAAGYIAAWDRRSRRRESRLPSRPWPPPLDQACRQTWLAQRCEHIRTHCQFRLLIDDVEDRANDGWEHGRFVDYWKGSSTYVIGSFSYKKNKKSQCHNSNASVFVVYTHRKIRMLTSLGRGQRLILFN